MEKPFQAQIIISRRVFLYVLKTCLKGIFKLLSSDYSLRFIPILLLYVRKCKFSSLYKVDSFIMLQFSHLRSCLVYLFVVKCTDWLTGRTKAERSCLNSVGFLRQYNWKDQHLHYVANIYFIFFHKQMLWAQSRNPLKVVNRYRIFIQV